VTRTRSRVTGRHGPGSLRLTGSEYADHDAAGPGAAAAAARAGAQVTSHESQARDGLTGGSSSQPGASLRPPSRAPTWAKAGAGRRLTEPGLAPAGCQCGPTAAVRADSATLMASVKRPLRPDAGPPGAFYRPIST
jgi:hypothetical protein